MLYRFDKRYKRKSDRVICYYHKNHPTMFLETQSRLVIGMLKGASIDMKISSHFTRSTSTSIALSVNLPADLILKAGGLNSMKS